MFCTRAWLALIVASFACTWGYAGVHPVALEKNADCLECHADKSRDGNVHLVLRKKCVACHVVEVKSEATYVNLKREGSAGCFACHQQGAFHYPHFPYSSGMCVRCHDPHGPEYPKLLKASVNTLCLECHLRSAQTAESRYMPTISLSNHNSVGHPYAAHPVSGKIDPLTGKELSCLSCHTAHGGEKKHLLRMGGAIPEDVLNETTETRDLCAKCHDEMWGVGERAKAKAGKNRKTK